jgi:hypothetical protein
LGVEVGATLTFDFVTGVAGGFFSDVSSSQPLAMIVKDTIAIIKTGRFIALYIGASDAKILYIIHNLNYNKF